MAAIAMESEGQVVMGWFAAAEVGAGGWGLADGEGADGEGGNCW